MNYALLVKLICAHIIADFVLQWKGMCVQKLELNTSKGWMAQILHALIHAVLAYTLVADWTCWLIPVVIFSTHFLIDVTKTMYGNKDYVWHFMLDQMAHILVIVILFYFLNGNILSFQINIKLLVVIVAYIVVTVPTAIFIDKFYNQWNFGVSDKKCNDEVECGDKKSKQSSEESLYRGGTYIGILERLLVLTFIFVGYYEGIGFLMAAKSVFRFGDLKNNNELRHTEYVLIGTFLSFAIAVLIGFFTKRILQCI